MTRERWIRVARWGAGAGGAAMVAVALLADRLGLDHSPTFGTGETLLLAAGVVAVALAALGRRAPSAWRTTALVLANTLVLLVAVELAAVAVATLTGASLGTGGVVDRLTGFYLRHPYYAEREWSATYWRENAEAGARDYRPYVGWRRPPYAGETVNVGDDGFRAVPGADCGVGEDRGGADRADADRVLALGGSTMWGWGAPDGGTIPAHLQRGLEAAHAGPVCVRNLGETAWVSSQELVQLVLALRDGERPDLVIFYDGVNDTLAAHQAGRAGPHQNLPRIAAHFESGRAPLLRFLADLTTVRLAHHWLGLPAPARGDRSPAETEALAAEVVRTYLGVVEVASALAASRGFEARFFWQPYLSAGDKPLAPIEAAMLDGHLDWAMDPDPAPYSLFDAVYRRLAEVDDPRIHDLSGVFDDVEEAVWIDPWGHVTPRGNEIVTARMLELLAAPEAEAEAENDER